MSEIEDVLEKIEQLRKKLYIVSKDKDFSDPEVIAASQMLDAVLNEYQKIISKKKGDQGG